MINTIQILDELNELRKDPKKYADKVKKYMDMFEGDTNILNIPNVGRIQTQEGKAAYQECLGFLKAKPPCPKLERSTGLEAVAKDFYTEYSKDAQADVDMQKVIDKHGKYTGQFSRLIEFGAGNPEQVIVNLLVSDGDEKRGQRDALFLETVKQVGIASGKHEQYRTCSVIVSAGQFTSK